MDRWEINSTVKAKVRGASSDLIKWGETVRRNFVGISIIGTSGTQLT